MDGTQEDRDAIVGDARNLRCRGTRDELAVAIKISPNFVGELFDAGGSCVLDEMLDCQGLDF